MGDFGWICGVCTDHNEGSRTVCGMCSTERSGAWSHLPFFQTHRTTITARALRSLTSSDGTLPFPLSICSVPRFLAGALSGAITGMFAVVGAFTGAVTGALAGRATDSGLLRGAGLGAIAGAVLSVEVLEASRAYWNSERAGAQPSSSVTEFIEDMLNGRFVQDQVNPAMLTANRWQVNLTEMSYEDLYEMFGPGDGVIKGVSETFLEKLPQHTVTKDNKVDCNGDSFCCTICLQELVQGEQARSLPLCHHVFHLPCVDKWLVRHGSCPVCRRGVQGKV